MSTVTQTIIARFTAGQPMRDHTLGPDELAADLDAHFAGELTDDQIAARWLPVGEDDAPETATVPDVPGPDEADRV